MNNSTPINCQNHIMPCGYCKFAGDPAHNLPTCPVRLKVVEADALEKKANADLAAAKAGVAALEATANTAHAQAMASVETARASAARMREKNVTAGKQHRASKGKKEETQ